MLICPKCRIDYEEGKKFCRECGSALVERPSETTATPSPTGIPANSGQYERAIEDYNKAIELNPNFANAYKCHGDAYYLLEQYERAIEDYNKAIEDYNKAIELNPNFADAYKWRGDAYYLLEQYERAIEDLSKAIELGDANAFFALIAVKEQMGEP